MPKLRILYLLLQLLVFIATASAQDEDDFCLTKFYTIIELKRNASTLDQNNVPIKTKGYVVQQSSSEMFVFQDETGVIKVHISPKTKADFYYNENIEIVLTGEINYELFRIPVIEVKEISLPKTRID